MLTTDKTAKSGINYDDMMQSSGPEHATLAEFIL